MESVSCGAGQVCVLGLPTAPSTMRMGETQRMQIVSDLLTAESEAALQGSVTPNCGLSFCTNYFTAATVESRVYVTSIAALGTAGLGIQLAPWTLCGNLEACPTLPGVEGTVEVTVSVHGVLPTQFSVSFGVNVTAGVPLSFRPTASVPVTTSAFVGLAAPALQFQVVDLWSNPSQDEGSRQLCLQGGPSSSITIEGTPCVPVTSGIGTLQGYLPVGPSVNVSTWTNVLTIYSDPPLLPYYYRGLSLKAGAPLGMKLSGFSMGVELFCNLLYLRTYFLPCNAENFPMSTQQLTITPTDLYGNSVSNVAFCQQGVVPDPRVGCISVLLSLEQGINAFRTSDPTLYSVNGTIFSLNMPAILSYTPTFKPVLLGVIFTGFCPDNLCTSAGLSEFFAVRVVDPGELACFGNEWNAGVCPSVDFLAGYENPGPCSIENAASAASVVNETYFTAQMISSGTSKSIASLLSSFSASSPVFTFRFSPPSRPNGFPAIHDSSPYYDQEWAITSSTFYLFFNSHYVGALSYFLVAFTYQSMEVSLEKPFCRSASLQLRNQLTAQFLFQSFNASKGFLPGEVCYRNQSILSSTVSVVDDIVCCDRSGVCSPLSEGNASAVVTTMSVFFFMITILGGLYATYLWMRWKNVGQILTVEGKDLESMSSTEMSNRARWILAGIITGPFFVAVNMVMLIFLVNSSPLTLGAIALEAIVIGLWYPVSLVRFVQVYVRGRYPSRVLAVLYVCAATALIFLTMVNFLSTIVLLCIGLILIPQVVATQLVGIAVVLSTVVTNMSKIREAMDVAELVLRRRLFLLKRGMKIPPQVEMVYFSMGRWHPQTEKLLKSRGFSPRRITRTRAALESFIQNRFGKVMLQVLIATIFVAILVIFVGLSFVMLSSLNGSGGTSTFSSLASIGLLLASGKVGSSSGNATTKQGQLGKTAKVLSSHDAHLLQRVREQEMEEKKRMEEAESTSSPTMNNTTIEVNPPSVNSWQASEMEEEEDEYEEERMEGNEAQGHSQHRSLLSMYKFSSTNLPPPPRPSSPDS